MSEHYAVELFGLPYFWGISSRPAAFLFLIFLSTKSSSYCVNSPSLMSNCLLIILVTGSCVTFGGFPSKFSKCCFHRCICSFWMVAFSLAFAELFLLFTSFIVFHAILDYLSSTESLILSIWFCMHSVCSFRYVLIHSFCAFLSFRALVLVGFFLLHLEVVFTLVCILLQLLSRYWRNSHIRHSEYVFLSSPVVHRICFFVLTHIYL